MTVDKTKKFAVNDSYYSWCVRTYETVRKGLGLNVKVHPNNDLLKQGHIFLFNHFARFETVIPPYLIYRATGAYSRSVADFKLFEGNTKLASFLIGAGAIPNNQEGLLAFLAAEILRGRKVVMFPEGGMVKDRKVIDNQGKYGIFSVTADKHRKHHRGAAVLALTLDIFKKRILDLETLQDHARIQRWVNALGLDDVEQLLIKVREPTLIIPATITFFPIRIGENILSRAVGLFTKDLPDRIAEEMLVEGNLIFRDTDMDIRLNPAINTDKKWRWWEKKLLNRYFSNITSLDEFFGLHKQANSLSERMLDKCISNETLRIRDQYMQELYTGITVNLSHLASSIITNLIDEDQTQINISEFHLVLYLSLKKLQGIAAIHLHRSLKWPDRYRRLLDGENTELERFLRTCNEAGLVEETRTSYRLRYKLRRDYSQHKVRLENPISVYANEVGPITQVVDTIKWAMDKSSRINECELANLLFDDELRAYEWNREHYSRGLFDEINSQETATEDAAPYFIRPQKNNRKGVLLVHGFLASPAELSRYGHQLSKSGMAVMGVRLAGHGTSPWDLKSRTWKDWINSVRRGYKILSAFVDEIVIIGFSMGGILSLIIAAEHPTKLTGVAAVSAPLVYRNKTLALVPLVHGLNKLTDWLPSIDGIMPFRENISEHPEINYRHIPLQGLYELQSLTHDLEKHLSHITAPTFIIQGDDDPIVDPISAKRLFEQLTAADKSIKWVKSDRHGILFENIDGTWDALTRFLEHAFFEVDHLSAPRLHPPPRAMIKPVDHILSETASRTPDRPCLDFLGRTTNYADIENLVLRSAKGFQNLGIIKGDRIGLCLPNCPYYVISYYAALKIGAVVVNFNPLYTMQEISHQIIDSGTRLMVTLDVKTIFPKIDAALDITPLEKIVVCSLSNALPAVKGVLFNIFKRSEIASIPNDNKYLDFDDLTNHGDTPEPVAIDPLNDLAVLQYTGGTTGVPKGAMLTHANVVANVHQAYIWTGAINPEGERILCVIPFFHAFAMTVGMNLGIMTGAELILLPRFELKTVLKTITDRKPTLFPVVPTLLTAINTSTETEGFNLSSIRFCISGGAPLPEKTKTQFEDLTGCIVVEGYGLSEASPVVSCNPADGENKTGSIGLPFPWTEVQFLDLDDAEKILGIGERGQLAVKGPQVMAGYWNNTQATADTIKSGWLLTGDIGFRDKDGYLFITDRLKDIIICSGFKVYPRAIEDVLYQHPSVEEAIVIGIPDEYRGEAPKAFVKLKSGRTISEAELLTFANKTLNPIERPTRVEIRKELPKTLIGKLSKKELIEQHKQLLAKQNQSSTRNIL